MKKIFLLHSTSELTQLKKLYSESFTDAEFCFLTSSTDLSTAKKFGINTIEYFDDFLSNEELKSLSIQARELSETWFLDKNKNDLTHVDGFSIGKCFQSLTTHLFTILLKYELLILRLEHLYDQVFITETPNELLSFLINKKTKTLSKFIILPTKDMQGCLIPSSTVAFNQRDMKVFFQFKYSAANILQLLFTTACQLFCGEKGKIKIMMTYAGKLDGFIERRVLKKSQESELQFIFPLMRSSLKLNRSNLYFYILPLPGFGFLKINKLKKNLLENLHGDEKLEVDVLKLIITTYLSPFFQGMYGYFNSSQSQLKRISPDLVILSAESHQTNIIIAQAAKKLRIKTATIPHGMTYPLLPISYYQKGKNQIYNSAFIFSNSFSSSYTFSGFKNNDLYLSSFSYFYKFINSRKISRVKTNSALVLPPDYSDFSKAGYVIKGLQTCIESCISLEVDKIAIKARVRAQLQALLLSENGVIINGKIIPVFYGYSDFLNIAQSYDFTIGPISSALIEASLAGIDYYLFNPDEANISTWENTPIEDICYIAKTNDELRFNIENKKIFKPGKSIDDIIYITGFQNIEEIDQLFESSILSCMKFKEGAHEEDSDRMHNRA